MKKWLACLLFVCCLITATAEYEDLYTIENVEVKELVSSDEWLFYNWDIFCKAPLYWGVIYSSPNASYVYVDESAPLIRNIERFETAKANGELIPDPDEPGIWRAPDWPDLDLEAAYRQAWRSTDLENLRASSNTSTTKALFREWIAGMTEEEFAEAFPLDKPYGHFWQDWLNAVYTD